VEEVLEALEQELLLQLPLERLTQLLLAVVVHQSQMEAIQYLAQLQAPVAAEVEFLVMVRQVVQVVVHQR
jgi:hypothetical protein